MRRLSLRAVAIAILLWLLATPVWAGLEEADAAYQRGDYEAALRELRPLANQGNANTQNNLGNMYAEGHGVPQDHAEAVRWYRKAANQGYAEAQHNLGVMYDKGEGVPQDYVEAVRWFRKAANQGDASAQTNLGIMYFRGEVVLRDLTQAYMWYDLASSRIPPGAAHDHAVRNRDFVAKHMTRAQIAEAKRLAREWTERHNR